MTPTPFASERTILITGCSSGIGLASARVMQARGWRVYATARTAADLTRLADEGFDAVPLELRDPASIAACAERVLQQTGGELFALFNNAAYGQPGAVEDLPVERLRDSFEVNLFGGHDLTRRILPVMRKRGRGRIVQCSSVLGFISPPWRGAYNATKHALEALSDSMRHELAGSGIGVSVIEPGPIESRFLEHAMAALRAHIDLDGSVHRDTYRARIAAMERGGRQTWKLPPEKVAEKLVHAVESLNPKSRYYVTVPTYMAAAGRRLLPRRLQDRMIRGA